MLRLMRTKHIFLFLEGYEKCRTIHLQKEKKKNTQYEGAFKTQEGKNLIFYREIDNLTSLIKTTAY